MPSKSKAQARFMAAAAHNPDFAKKAGISTGAAKEWNQADKKQGTLKKGSDKPDHVDESSMTSFMDLTQDAKIADDIAQADKSTEISRASQNKKLGKTTNSLNQLGEEEELTEMPQRLNSFAKQNRDEFVDKSAKVAGSQNMELFAQHDGYDVMKSKNGSSYFAVDKQGNQIAMISGQVSKNTVQGVARVFVVHSAASKTGVKGVVYQMYMDLVNSGTPVLSDVFHSDDAIKFWTRLLTNHTVYVVADGEVLTRATPDKVHKYWSDDEYSPSAELRLMLVK